MKKAPSTSKKTQVVTYKDAGVDIDAGDALVDKIKPLASATNRKGTMGGIGGFGALFDVKKAGYKDPILVSSTDGVGTKLKIAQELNKHETIGIDLVAMCVNDLVVQGGEPLFFLDYFATGKLSVGVAAKVVKGIAEGCKLAGCALVGGETAEMPGMYAPGEYDLAGFSVGAVERDKILPKKGIKTGDVLIGLESSGVHSNGFSLVRKIMELKKLDYRSPAPFAKGKSIGDVLLTPTKIYVKSCLKAINRMPDGVKALAHITGGGVENIPRVLGAKQAVEIDAKSWPKLPVFKWLQEEGNIPEHDMRRTFNNGIGMILIVSPAAVKSVCALLTKEGETVHVLGKVIPRKGEAVIFRE